jgi:hypothetical protein
MGKYALREPKNIKASFMATYTSITKDAVKENVGFNIK